MAKKVLYYVIGNPHKKIGNAIAEVGLLRSKGLQAFVRPPKTSGYTVQVGEEVTEADAKELVKQAPKAVKLFIVKKED